LRSAGSLCGEDEDGAEVIDIGQGRTGHHEIAEGGEKSVRIVRGQRLFDGDAASRGAGDRVRVDNRPRIVLGSVDAIGVAGERRDALRPAGIFSQRGGEREPESRCARRGRLPCT
jgi:hypothetical protein